MESLIQYNDDDIRPIRKIKFNVLGNQETKSMSVIKDVTSGINIAELYDSMEPKRGGLIDPRMGVSSDMMPCQTCGLNSTECVGHFGHIELVESVFHVGFLDYTRKILSMFCQYCSSLLVNKNKHDLLEILKHKSGKGRFTEIKNMTKNVSSCYVCGNTVSKIKKVIKKTSCSVSLIASIIDKDDKDQKKREYILTPEMCFDILKGISDIDMAIIGLASPNNKNGIKERPEDLIIKNLPVPPVIIRPSAKVDILDVSVKEDDMTHKLADIVKNNNRIIKYKESTGEVNIKYNQENTNLLQYHISSYYDNETLGLPKSERNNKPATSLVKRLKGKEGRIRGNLLGKRTDFSARTVITSDPTIDINQLGVPKKIAMNITVPETVTPDNIERLTQLVKNGRYKYPGANFVFPTSNSNLDEFKKIRPIDLRFRKEDIILKYGFIVERHLIDNDYVLFNRQPTLHMLSMMGHRVKVLHNDELCTFRVNVAVTRCYNADFDGDEMNFFAAQSIQSLIELEEIADVKKQIIVPGKGVPLIGAVQDVLLGAYNMSHDNIKIGWKDVMNIIAYTDIENYNIDKRIYSGKEVLSMIIPKDITLKIGETSIVNGQLVKGQLSKAFLGTGAANSLIHYIWDIYGSNGTKTFIDNINRLVNNFNLLNGFTVGIGDIDVSDELKKNMNILMETKILEVSHLITSMENNPDLLDFDIFERNLTNELNAIRGNNSKMIMDNFKNLNNFRIMLKSGSKGSEDNIGQMAGAVGQQTVEGKRPQKKTNMRVTHYQFQNDDTAKGRGFVDRPFIDGVDPIGFMFHNMGSREGLIDTAIKSVTGDTPIIIEENGMINKVLIGNWIDTLLKHNPTKIEYHQEQNMELLKLNHPVYIPTSDYDGNVSWGLISAITKHDPGNQLYKITTQGGRSVIVTKSKSLLIWNEKLKKFVMTSTPNVVVGDYAPATLQLCDPPTIVKTLDVRNYLDFNDAPIFTTMIELDNIFGKFIALCLIFYNKEGITLENNNLLLSITSWLDTNKISFDLYENNIRLLDELFLKFLVKLMYNTSKISIPSMFINAPLEFVNGFTHTYVTMKSNYMASNDLYIRTPNNDFAHDFNMLLSRLGIYGQTNTSIVYIKSPYISTFAHIALPLINDIKVQNNVVLDKIVEIELVDVALYPKVYDLTVPSTLNFGLANGLHVVDTAESGYIQRKLVKLLEDIMVNYDGLVRNASGYIIQYVYGDSGINNTSHYSYDIKMLNMNYETIKNTYTFTKEELSQTSFSQEENNKYYEYLLKLVKQMRKSKLKSSLNSRTFDSTLKLPVNINRYVNNIKKNTVVDKSLSPDYIIKRIDDIISYNQTKIFCLSKKDRQNINSLKYKDELLCKMSFKLALHDSIGPKHVINNKMTKSDFDKMCDSIVKDFNKAIIEPGKMVGVISAQSIGEPTTQLTLNSFHSAGIGGKGAASLGVPRMKELLSLSKNIKSPQMSIYLLDKYKNDNEVTKKISFHMKVTIMSDIIIKEEIYYDPKPQKPDGFMNKDKVKNVFHSFNPSKNACTTDINVLPWLVRVQLDREKMMEKNITLLDIKSQFCTNWEKRYSDAKGTKKEKTMLEKITQCCILSNNDNDALPTIHIRFNMKEFDFSVMIDFLDIFIDNFKLKGIENIAKILDRSEERYEMFDKKTGEKVLTNQFVIYTDGINMKDIRYINGIDLNKTVCNNVIDIFNLYGIRAARTALLREFETVFAGGGTEINQQHWSVLVDTMINSGILTSIDRHGLNKMDVDPLARASFEKTVDQLIQAAVYGETDHMRSVSSRIMAGCCIKGGTGLCEISLDTDLIINSEYTEDTDQMFHKTYVELGENIIINDTLDKDGDVEMFIPE